MNKDQVGVVVVGCLAIGLLALSLASKKSQDTSRLLGISPNLRGLDLQCEPNPGGILTTDANENDVAVEYFDSYGTLISNPHQRPIWANAFLVKKYVDTFPNGDSLKPYKCYLEWETQCPALPVLDANYQQNPEQVDCDITFYDGSGKFGLGAKTRWESALMWKLNPWSEGYGKVIVRLDNLNWYDLGIRIEPDLKWHKFRIEADFTQHLVTKVIVDGRVNNTQLPMWVHEQPDWGPETAIWADIDTSSTYPVGSDGVLRTFWWKQNLRNYKWGTL